MGQLSIYADDRGRTALHETGFSWIAGLAPLVWAVIHRRWATAVLVGPLGVAVQWWGNALTESGAGGLSFAVALLQLVLLGNLAAWWHRLCLRRAGYRLVAAAPSLNQVLVHR